MTPRLIPARQPDRGANLAMPTAGSADAARLDLPHLPDDPSTRDYQRIAQAIAHCVHHWPEHPRLAELARVVGVSPWHFQRLFHRWAGVTAKTFLDSLVLNEAKSWLERTSVLDSSLELGLSSPSRLHDLFLSCEAMTPGDYRSQGKGLDLCWGIHPTSFGSAVFVLTPRGLCGLQFLTGLAAQGSGAGLAAEALLGQWPRARTRRDQATTGICAQQLQHRLQGRSGAPLSVVLHGTAFQLQVWQALLRIPAGEVRSYGAVARALGRPGAVRAVGSAIGRNPIGYLIPCHRVLRASGALGGYRWGESRKRTILAWEWGRRLRP